MSVRPTGLVFFSAADVCRPGTLARITDPGLKPSRPLNCDGATCTPLTFLGICDERNASTRPAGGALLRAVNASLGNGSMEVVAARAGAATASAATTTAPRRKWDMRRDAIRRG